MKIILSQAEIQEALLDWVGEKYDVTLYDTVEFFVQLNGEKETSVVSLTAHLEEAIPEGNEA